MIRVVLSLQIVPLRRYTEILTWALLSRAENFAALRKKDDGASAVGIGNPATAEFEVCRTSLLPGPFPPGMGCLRMFMYCSQSWVLFEACEVNACKSTFESLLICHMLGCLWRLVSR
jgi:Phenylalanyl tRNA synthetase beta chain CLM domain